MTKQNNDILEKSRYVKHDELLILTQGDNGFVGAYDTFTSMVDSINERASSPCSFLTEHYIYKHVTRWRVVCEGDINFTVPYYVYKVKLNEWREFV